EEERGDDVRTSRSVHDLRMELDAVHLLGGVRDGAKWGVVRQPDGGEARRHARDAVTVAHPDVDALATREAVEDARWFLDDDVRQPELALLRALDLAPEQVGHQLHAVADAEDRDAELEDALVDFRRAVLVDARR